MSAEKYELNPKVGIPMAAGAAVTILVGVLKQANVVDLSAYHGELTLVVMSVVGYLVPAA